jgi:hypothetical protein
MAFWNNPDQFSIRSEKDPKNLCQGRGVEALGCGERRRIANRARVGLVG